MQDDDGVIVMSEVEYDKDNHIRVLAGPLKGQEGRITKVDRRKGRVKVKFALANIRREIWLGVRMAQAIEHCERKVV
jgi:transcriptional antiterminator NusG